jgi:hypothetical protein
LTASGGGHQGGRYRKEIFFESGRPASIFTPMVVKLVGQ